MESAKSVAKIADSVDGMMLPESIYIWQELLKIENDTRKWSEQSGSDYLEIGTYKGKSASILAHYSNMFENDLIIVDPVLDEKTKEFIASIKKEVKFLEHRSEYLKFSEIFSSVARSCSFIHIDGMHTFSAVVNDLHLAEDLCNDFGIICIDDFGSNLYPQIPAAVYSYLYTTNSDLSLFLVGFNKAYLCRNIAKRYYHTLMRDNFAWRIQQHGFDINLIKTDRHDRFDAFVVDYCDPAHAGDLNK